jgi:hypothetical protein
MFVELRRLQVTTVAAWTSPRTMRYASLAASGRCTVGAGAAQASPVR